MDPTPVLNPMTARRALLIALAGLAGCATPPPAPVPYQPPAGGPDALLTVQTERMWAPNRVTLYLVRTGTDPKPAAPQVVGQLQSGEQVRREVLTFDVRLAAGVPLSLFFEYRYDAGSLLENGCDYPVTLTLTAGMRYLVDFIKDTRGCQPRFYAVGKDGARTEMQVQGR
jgi:hypothetical protein